MRFSKVKEHEAVKELLAREIETGRLVSFYLVLGPEGVGKSLLARSFGRYLLCQGDRDDDCQCRSCRLWLSGNHPDALFLGEGDAAELKLEDAITARDFLRMKPYMGGRRYVLVLDAERLNPSAQNALLKTLEEPPPGTVLLFTSSRQEMFLETVQSRARLIRTGALSQDACTEVLQGLGLESGEARFLAEASGGSPGRALSFRQVSGSVRAAADTMVKALGASRTPFEAARPVLDRLGEMETPAERRLYLSTLASVLAGVYRKRFAAQGSEPLGAVVSCLTEMYRATLQNVRPELIVLITTLRLSRALKGETSPLCGVII